MQWVVGMGRQKTEKQSIECEEDDLDRTFLSATFQIKNFNITAALCYWAQLLEERQKGGGQFFFF